MMPPPREEVLASDASAALANGEWKVATAWHSTRLRKSAGGVIGVGFVLLLIASFIIWFPAGWFQGYGAQDIITVGDVKIGPQEYMRAATGRAQRDELASRAEPQSARGARART